MKDKEQGVKLVFVSHIKEVYFILKTNVNSLKEGGMNLLIFIF